MLLHFPMERPFIIFIFFMFFTISSIAHDSVPSDQTFKHVNKGAFGDFIEEYDATYRALSLLEGPFQLCFYNTTPNAFTLALSMGTSKSRSLKRWVWDANRGKPVRENASLKFSTDGNLVLADADGRIAWQTNTADKGVVGLKILENGNMVLYDSNGKFVWQSFDYPTDILLVGQSLKRGTTTKLVSRASVTDNSDGPYSLVLENSTLNMYYKSPNSPKPMLYFSFRDWLIVSKLDSVTFGPKLSLDYEGNRSLFLRKAMYNTTFSFLRLEIDGNIKLHTYDNGADWGAWEETYTQFDRNYWVSECQLPDRCGNFGLCENNQCVGCPTPRGSFAWSKNCQPPKVTSCDVKDFRYYKLEGVDHFITKYTDGDGPMKVDDCSKKCTRDCKCLGYFYNTESSRCWLAYDLMTLKKVEDSINLAYIKAPRKSSMNFPISDM